MNYDVAVVGAGMTGATLACALAKAGLRVAVIEASDPPPPPGDERQLRVSAISRASERVLRAIDVWDALPLERAGVFREMRVW
ncbi:MAG: FAD-dependent oxidoreductase, partial [Gammaproteobacteria bacterium]|nr:FAD-dependent oxidoreductase [Gammaproteobacteria bacterium]